jgi:hypothetical protein
MIKEKVGYESKVEMKRGEPPDTRSTTYFRLETVVDCSSSYLIGANYIPFICIARCNHLNVNKSVGNLMREE